MFFGFDPAVSAADKRNRSPCRGLSRFSSLFFLPLIGLCRSCRCFSVSGFSEVHVSVEDRDIGVSSVYYYMFTHDY